MKRTIQALAMLMAITLAAVWMVGCGGTAAGPSATLKSATPPEGSTIAGNAEITITLDNPVKAGTTLQVNGEDAKGAGTSWKWKGAAPLPEGPQTLSITWTNDDDSAGSATVSYTVVAPDTTPPAIASSTPKDGDKDLDPEKLNTDGMEIKFSEPVKKANVDVTVEDTPLKWTAELSDDKTTVNLVMLKGGELSYETEVVLVINAEDEAGNKLEDAKITFTTKAKEG